nr:VOC family protein [Paraburkholderia sp. BL6669N2]
MQVWNASFYSDIFRTERSERADSTEIEMTDIMTAMKLNHVSFPSSDVSATAAFFEDHLGWTVAAREGRAGF